MRWSQEPDAKDKRGRTKAGEHGTMSSQSGIDIGEDVMTGPDVSLSPPAALWSSTADATACWHDPS